MGIFERSYAIDKNETWRDCAWRVAYSVCSNYVGTEIIHKISDLIYKGKFVPAGRYLANAGNPKAKYKTYSNCLAYKIEDSREAWAQAMHDVSLSLMKGIGVGINVFDVRANGSPMSIGTASGSVSVLHMINEMSRHIAVGGIRRVALMGLQDWKHGDIKEFLATKRLTKQQLDYRQKDMYYPVPLDMMNISVGIDDAFFGALENNEEYVLSLYNNVMDSMIEHGEPGFIINAEEHKDQIYVNPCGEYRTSKPNTICNLGSINLANIGTQEELEKVIGLAVLFLLCGREESELPFEGSSNPSIGLGIMGLHSWLIERNYPYSVPAELVSWLRIYEQASDYYANYYADILGVSVPEHKRAIAPNGTTAIVVGEATGKYPTSGIEPLFCKAYKRTWQDGNSLKDTYFIDDAAIHNPDIEDSYVLSSSSGGIEKRLNVLASVQQYVDMGISVTVNLHKEANQKPVKSEIKNIVRQYLPFIRGLTMYRDGSRGKSPLTPISVEEALKYIHNKSTEYGECVGGSCGI